MMKQIYFLLTMMCLSLMAHAQAIHVFHDGQPKADVYLNAEIDSIRLNSVAGQTDQFEYQIHTPTGVMTYDAEKVDSIKFNLPHLKLVWLNGKCKIPKEDNLYFLVMLYCDVDDQNLVMKTPDGKEFGHNRLSSSSSYGHHLHKLNIPVNELYESKEGQSEEMWYAVEGDGERCDSIAVEFTGSPLFKNRWHNIGVSSEITEFKLLPLIDNVRFNSPWVTGGMEKVEFEDGDENWEYDWADWKYDSDGNIVIRFQENESSEKRELTINPHTAYITCFDPIGRFVQATKYKHSAEEHMQAMKDFYNSTSLKDLNTNWFTDEPLWKWDFYVNQDIGSDFYWHVNDHVLNLYTSNEGPSITGTLPPSFEVFLDDVHGNGNIGLGNCALNGPIPQNIKNNPNWNEFGWDIIPQLVWSGGGFDFEGSSNLFLDDCEVVDFISGQTTNVYAVLKENKLTWVFNGGAVDMIDGISDERVNKFLDYKDKSFGVVVTVGGYWDTPYDDYKNYVLHEREMNGLPEEILWTKGFDKADIGSYGSMSLVNDRGELVWYRSYDYDLPDRFYLDQIDEICRQYFGEPSDHPIYSSRTYESTDFSRDGEVLVLQQAAVGRGIDLVLTGDQFIDTDMEEGGVFETQVKEAMENFFSVEPYTSLRDRFNVYAVKAVSLNDYRGTDHVFKNDDSKVLEYVGKIPDIDMDNVTVAVLRYDPNYQFFVSGYASLLENGAAIAYLEQGNASEVIVHEAGGHGFGKLLDEYIYGEAADNRVPDENLEEFKAYIKGYYHDRGWGMNVSTTDAAEEVPWSRLLKDSRYEGEVGIYQGAWLYPYDLWRSSENSVMKEVYDLEFNAPSREAIYKRIMQLSVGDDWTYDYETFVAFDRETRQREKQSPAKTATSQKTVIHKMPKLRRIVDGKVVDIPTPFSDVKDSVISHPVKGRIQKNSVPRRAESSPKRINENPRKRDRVVIQGGHVMTSE